MAWIIGGSTKCRFICLLAFFHLVQARISNNFCGDLTCTCESSKWNGVSANCSKRGFADWHVNLPKNLDDLDISNNEIPMRNLKSFNMCMVFSNLKSVSLAQNDLTDIGSIFKGCWNLLEINLAGNKLQSVEAFTFQEAVNLTHLILESNSLEPNALDMLSHMEVLDLTYHARFVEAGLFKRMYQLNDLTLKLSRCQILPDGLLNIPSLRKLRITGPKVKFISSSFFSTLDNLQRLHLDLPQLQQLSMVFKLPSLKEMVIKSVKKLRFISSLGGLEILRLERIDDLPKEEPFGTLKHLQTLDLINCSLSRIPPGWFAKLTSLKELNLNQNDLASLDKNSFSGLVSLRQLNLSKNKFKSVPMEALTTPLYNVLESLVLSHNYIDAIQAGVLAHLKNMKRLDLSYNGIRTIDRGTFTETGKLVNNFLPYNALRPDNHLFSNNHVQDKLYRTGNPLIRILHPLSSSAMQGLHLSKNHAAVSQGKILCAMPRLAELRLEGNPINCSCEVKKLFDCLINKKTKIYGTCGGPEHLKNMQVADFTGCSYLLDGYVSKMSLLKRGKAVSNVRSFLQHSTQEKQRTMPQALMDKLNKEREKRETGQEATNENVQDGETQSSTVINETASVDTVTSTNDGNFSTEEITALPTAAAKTESVLDIKDGNVQDDEIQNNTVINRTTLDTATTAKEPELYTKDGNVQDDEIQNNTVINRTKVDTVTAAKDGDFLTEKITSRPIAESKTDGDFATEENTTLPITTANKGHSQFDSVNDSGVALQGKNESKQPKDPQTGFQADDFTNESVANVTRLSEDVVENYSIHDQTDQFASPRPLSNESHNLGPNSSSSHRNLPLNDTKTENKRPGKFDSIQQDDEVEGTGSLHSGTLETPNSSNMILKKFFPHGLPAKTPKESPDTGLLKSGWVALDEAERRPHNETQSSVTEKDLHLSDSRFANESESNSSQSISTDDKTAQSFNFEHSNDHNGSKSSVLIAKRKSSSSKVDEDGESFSHIITTAVILGTVVVVSLAVVVSVFFRYRMRGAYLTGQHESLNEELNGDISMQHYGMTD